MFANSVNWTWNESQLGLDWNQRISLIHLEIQLKLSIFIFLYIYVYVYVYVYIYIYISDYSLEDNCSHNRFT